jgi:hypothetical protein
MSRSGTGGSLVVGADAARRDEQLPPRAAQVRGTHVLRANDPSSSERGAPPCGRRQSQILLQRLRRTRRQSRLRRGSRLAATQGQCLEAVQPQGSPKPLQCRNDAREPHPGAQESRDRVYASWISAMNESSASSTTLSIGGSRRPSERSAAACASLRTSRCRHTNVTRMRRCASVVRALCDDDTRCVLDDGVA